jgi:hypothetical protein
VFLGFACISAFWAALLSGTAGDVACPLKHGQWEPFPALTDEFEVGRLDESKWFPNNPGWLGRQPSYFHPNGYYAVGVEVRPLVVRPRGTVEVCRFPTEGGSPIQVTVRH